MDVNKIERLSAFRLEVEHDGKKETYIRLSYRNWLLLDSHRNVYVIESGDNWLDKLESYFEDNSYKLGYKL